MKKVKKKRTKDQANRRVQSRFGIKIRIILFFSALFIFLSLVMILYASATFTKESTTRIQESNFDYVRFSGDWLEAEFQNYIGDARYIIGKGIIGEGNKIGDDVSSKKSIIFGKGSQIIFIGSINSDRTISRYIINKDRAKLLNINPNRLKEIHLNTRSYISEAFSGETNVFNASIESIPLTGISFYDGGGARVVYIDPSGIQQQFEKREFTNIFMLNSDGDVIIHRDPEFISSRVNLGNLDLVKQMWESPLIVEQREYIDSDQNISYLAAYRKLNFGSLGLIAQVEKDIVYRPVREIQNRNLLILGIGLCLAIIVIYFLTKILTAPILTLSDAMGEVEKGKYVLPEIKKIPKHEIGNLIHSFKRMVTGLAEREKIRHLLGIFVSKEVAQTVIQDDGAQLGTKKKVVIFFSDIRGFTSISERLPAEKVVILLNKYLNRMVKCINDHGGVIDKFIGDGIMAHWGAFSSDGREVERAINASLVMRKSVQEFNAEMAKEKLPQIRIGVGLNYGEVIAGVVGSDERRQYTVIGDAVNLSSRIEGLTKIVGVDILIHENCYKQVKNLYHFFPFIPLQVKGKAENQKVYGVLGSKKDANAITNIDTLRAKLNIPASPQFNQLGAHPEVG